MSSQVEQSVTTRFLPGPIKRLRDHLREIRRQGGETMAAVVASHADITRRLDALSAQLDGQATRLEELTSAQEAARRQLLEALRFVSDRGQWRRQQLRGLRSDPDYERAFSEREPLISVVIPTYDNHTLLRDRSIPSVLGQSYQNFEVVVVADGPLEEPRRVVEGLGDARISFTNLPYRGPYPDVPEQRWLVAGVPPINEAIARARGLWIAPLADDDAFRPHHLERMLEHVREKRLELGYSRLLAHFSNSDEVIPVGRFPPEYQEFALQGGLYHAGLRDIFEFELADAAFGLPCDWGMCVRMMEAGVRIGMLDEITVDYYPSRSWTPRWEDDRYGPLTQPAPQTGA